LNWQPRVKFEEGGGAAKFRAFVPAQAGTQFFRFAWTAGCPAYAE
jgi:hypothetical protein